MSEKSVHLKIKINFPVIFITVLLIHVLFMGLDGLSRFTLAQFLPKEETPRLKIRRVKTAKAEHAKLKATEGIVDVGGGSPKKGPVSLKDLSVTPGMEAPRMARPGTRPEVLRKAPKQMKAISMKSQDMRDYSRSFPSGGLAISDVISQTQKINDAVVSIEVPEGVEPDELNQYELMFYGFQKRAAVNFINSILRNLNKFQKKYPNYKIPTSGTITMTARITYDPEGNVTQIRMMRGTTVNELQNLFEDIVKDMDQVHNPPKALWERNQEFSMFYTLEIING